jgi:hypothetical protein
MLYSALFSNVWEALNLIFSKYVAEIQIPDNNISLLAIAVFKHIMQSTNASYQHLSISAKATCAAGPFHFHRSMKHAPLPLSSS